MQSYAQPPSFLYTLEGLRGIAAVGVLLTHAAFQTGTNPKTLLGGILMRFDFFVAVFFSLSAFLLWRRWGVPGCANFLGKPDWKRYAASRIGRIFPAYLVLVGLVLLGFPDAYSVDFGAALANMTMLQIYVPNGLAPGLTHLWSLCVEVAFYCAVPFLAVAMSRVPQRYRIAVIVSASMLSLGWAYLPFVAASPTPGIPNMQIFPPAYCCWFAVGIIAAELENRPEVARGAAGRWLRRRWLWALVAIGVLWLAAQPFFGPLGLTHPSPSEFARRIVAGAVFAAALLVPTALSPDGGPRWLGSAPMLTLGRWSYAVFLWHLPMLGCAFSLLGIATFSGRFVAVVVVTLLLTIPIAAMSYTIVEVPMKKLFSQKKRFEYEKTAN